MPRKILRFPLGTREAAAAIFLLLSGCTPISLTMLGIGANWGISHQMSGFVARTFTEPLRPTQQAAEAALARMGMGISTRETKGHGGMIWARATDRNVEIELESLTPAATRMQVIVRRNLPIVVDPATAQEIIAQTERLLAAKGKPKR